MEHIIKAFRQDCPFKAIEHFSIQLLGLVIEEASCHEQEKRSEVIALIEARLNTELEGWQKALMPSVCKAAKNIMLA